MATEFGKSIKRIHAIRSSENNQLADLQRYQTLCIETKSNTGTLSEQQLGEYNAKLQQKRGLDSSTFPAMATYSHFNNIHINKNPSRPSSSMDAARSRTYHAAQVAQTLGVGGNASGMPPESGLGAYGNTADNNLSTRPNPKGLDSRSVLTTASMLPLPSAGGYSLSYVDHLGQLGHVEAAQPTMGHLLSATDAALGKFWAVTHSPETHLPIGCQVAAYVQPQPGEDEEDSEPNWLLGRIVDVRVHNPTSHDARTRGANSQWPLQYLVMDEDVSAPGSAVCQYMAACRTTGRPPQSVSTDLARVKTYLLPPSHVTPLPTLAEFPFSRRHEFPQGSYVLALYPEEGCTVFYRARVMKTAKKRKGPYQLRFDEEDEDRLVPAKFVIPYREGVAATRDDKWSGMSDDVGDS